MWIQEFGNLLAQCFPLMYDMAKELDWLLQIRVRINIDKPRYGSNQRDCHQIVFDTSLLT